MKGVFFTYLLPAGLINVGNVFAFLFQFLLARSLTVADYGNFNSLFAVINLLASPANIVPFAIARIMIRFEAVPGTARTIVEKTAIATSLGAVGVIALAAIFTTPISSVLRIDRPLTELLAFALLATTFLYTTAVGWLQGTGRYIAAAAALASIPTLRVVCTGAMEWAGYANLDTAFAATALPGLIVFAAGLVAMRGVFRAKRSALGAGASKDFFRFSALVSLSSLLLMGFWNLDIVIIRVLFSPEAAGLYSSAAVLGRIPFLVSGAIVNVMFPEATRAGLLGGEMRLVLFRSLGLTAGLGAVTALPMAFAAEPIIRLFAGPAYSSAAPLLGILGPAMALFAMVQVLVTFMLARDQYHALGILAAGLAVFVGACFVGATDPVWVAICLMVVIFIVFLACLGLALFLSSRPVQAGRDP